MPNCGLYCNGTWRRKIVLSGPGRKDVTKEPFILRFSDTKLCLKRHVYLYHSVYWTLQFQRLQLLNGYRFND